MKTKPVTPDLPAMVGIPNTLPPLCRRDIWRLSGFGALGFVILLVGLFPGFKMPELIVWPWLITCILLIVLAVLQTIKRKTFQNGSTSRPRPDLQKTLFTAVMLSFGFGFYIWGKSIGLPFWTIVAILLMIEGLAGVFVSLTDWWRLYHMGLSAGLIAAGFLLPVDKTGSIGTSVGTAIIIGTTTSAAILYWQIQYQERTSHRDFPKAS